MELAFTTDMLVEGTHFLPDTDPGQLGWKTLAVNLSDLAAMGATPKWVLLAGSLPDSDDAWIGAFAEGFFKCAKRYGADVIGGDTTRGPLTLAVQVHGFVPIGASAQRSVKLVKGATLKVYPKGSHGLASIQKDQLNTDLLAFIKG